MNTKPIPAIVMLCAGFVTCVVGIIQHFSFGTFVKSLFLILLVFAILGCALKLFLDKGFHMMQDPLSEYESLDLDEDLMDELTMSGDEYMDDYRDD